MGKISIIAALDSKRGIGKNGNLPWHIPQDLKRFKNLTMGHPIIMGRKTYDAVGRPLLGRTNIIVTSDKEKVISGVSVVNSLEEALEVAQNSPGSEEIFVIGGGQIFSQVMDKIDKLYLTLIEGDFQADTFFPDYSQFKKVVREQLQQSDGYKYKYVDLERA